MHKGEVIRFNSKNGWGWISAEDESIEDAFVHQNDIIEMEGYRYLKEGEKVEFETTENEQGIKAVNVRLLSERDSNDRPPHFSSPNGGRRNDQGEVSREEHYALVRKFNRLVTILARSDDEEPLLTPDEIEEINNAGHERPRSRRRVARV